MLLFMDGFDQFRDMPNAQLLDTLNASGYTAAGAVTLVDARDNTKRALQLGGDAIGTLKRVFTSTSTKMVLGFAYMATDERNDIAVIDKVGTISWDATTGKLSIAGSTGTATILLGLWYYIEVVVDKAGGALQLWVNNGKDIDMALPSTAQFLTTVDVTWTGPSSDAKAVDDIYFVDASTGKYTDRIGPIAILPRLPTSDVDREWTPSTGTDHWPLVDNQPPKDTDFIQANTSGASDTFLSNQGLPTDAQIIAVGITVLNRKSDIDARQLGMVMGQKGQTQKEVVDTNLSLTPKYSYSVFETAPSGSAWTDESVTNTPFGVVVRP